MSETTNSQNTVQTTKYIRSSFENVKKKTLLKNYFALI